MIRGTIVPRRSTVSQIRKPLEEMGTQLKCDIMEVPLVQCDASRPALRRTPSRALPISAQQRGVSLTNYMLDCFP